MVQHVPWEKPAALGDYLSAEGVPWRLTNLLGHQIVATALGAGLYSGTAAEVGVGEVDVVADGIFGRRGG
ncbi:hypothetical protein [Kribbella catacumbae]|uniref:hypothetical protein n=1 Tax=Kribbella catacumbae TaxID=460086 RepID=UPI00035F96B0|nr:hypothetical protein [Kribbella catacumbae]